jgi:hypothetical protein
VLSLWALFGLVAGASLVGVGATASAQELSIPVMVQTRPAIPGARFALDGTEFVANQHGLAVTTVAAPGTYELAVSSPTIEVEGASHSFSVWTGGERVSSRPLAVDSFTLLEAGFDTIRAVSFGFTDQDGTPIESDRIDHATIVETDGDTRYRIKGGQPASVIASRAVPTNTGITLLPVSYRLIEAVVDGRPVSGMESAFEVGVDSAVSIPVAVPAEPGDQPAEATDEVVAPNSPPTESSSRSLGVVAWGVFLAILSSLLIVLAGAALQRRWPDSGRLLRGVGSGLVERIVGGPATPTEKAKWARADVVARALRRLQKKLAGQRSRLSTMTWPARHQTDRADDAAAPIQGETEEAERPIAGNQNLRVHMISGRIIDGWTGPISQPGDDEVLHLVRVQHVYDRDGDEVASTPLDMFLVRSQIARIEHIDASTAPPPSTGPTADVVRLEENQLRKQDAPAEETVDLRTSSSKKGTKSRKSKGRSA